MREDDRYVAVTTTWREAKDALEKRLIETQDPKNPIVMMMDSGARGNISNFSQLAGMRGLLSITGISAIPTVNPASVE